MGWAPTPEQTDQILEARGILLRHLSTSQRRDLAIRALVANRGPFTRLDPACQVHSGRGYSIGARCTCDAMCDLPVRHE